MTDNWIDYPWSPQCTMLVFWNLKKIVNIKCRPKEGENRGWHFSGQVPNYQPELCKLRISHQNNTEFICLPQAIRQVFLIYRMAMNDWMEMPPLAISCFCCFQDWLKGERGERMTVSFVKFWLELHPVQTQGVEEGGEPFHHAQDADGQHGPEGKNGPK